ncbi:DUF3889 domain-containing protein [Metabacillus litoralis]|uniref:DUF3889 domain-containing protein n=1 Tax=Metabacillus litoralis TaxID=152268 RepID=UPI001CFF3BD6|nr:DUF3889 domain-containing protein [Metabacillus litoralis]
MKSISLSKIFFTFIAFVIILSAGMKAYGEHNDVDIEYKKWSRIAISSVQEKYPDTELIDYKYVKREEVNEQEAKDIFHVKANKKGRVFVVMIDVVFNPKTGKLITVKMVEGNERDF